MKRHAFRRPRVGSPGALPPTGGQSAPVAGMQASPARVGDDDGPCAALVGPPDFPDRPVSHGAHGLPALAVVAGEPVRRHPAIRQGMAPVAGAARRVAAGGIAGFEAVSVRLLPRVSGTVSCRLWGQGCGVWQAYGKVYGRGSVSGGRVSASEGRNLGAIRMLRGVVGDSGDWPLLSCRWGRARFL